jgi:hypothetical protein
MTGWMARGTGCGRPCPCRRLPGAGSRQCRTGPAPLAEQENARITLRVDREIRRGRDYVRVVLVATADAIDINVAEALDLAWQAFRKAAGGDVGWDLAAATADVRPL